MQERHKEILRYADSLVQKHSELLDQTAIWKYRVHSTMFIAAATILTLVCSLGDSISGSSPDIGCCGPDRAIWYLNTATVLLNGICLLALLGSLYQNIRATSQLMRRIEERFDALKKTLLIPADDALLVDGEYRTISSVGKSWFFSVCEWVAYISFILVVAGLIFRYYFA
jgi:hypothetical protein|uniref:hypothetical protein n=1 Tax=Alistipes onderdonkii TaxID=328813 RepID=UPI003FEFFED1